MGWDIGEITLYDIIARILEKINLPTAILVAGDSTTVGEPLSRHSINIWPLPPIPTRPAKSSTRFARRSGQLPRTDHSIRVQTSILIKTYVFIRKRRWPCFSQTMQHEVGNLTDGSKSLRP